MATSQTFALDALPWRLADYPDGGELLTAAVADSLKSAGVLIGPTCNALGPGSVPQIASGIAGIAQSIASSDSENAATIIDGLPACCTVMTSTDADTRISLGVAIAMKARGLAETDLQSAQEVESLVAICDDDVLGRSYELARGQDNLGTLIAEADDPDAKLRLWRAVDVKIEDDVTLNGFVYEGMTPADRATLRGVVPS